MSVSSIIDVTSAGELRAILGTPQQRVAEKDRPRLHELDRRWLAASPLCLLASSNADGRCDISPKGDPPGFAVVLDDTTIAIPERPGNRRGDTLFNIIGNPYLGALFLIPGRGDALRLDGRARIVREAPFFDRMTLRGHRPALAIVIEIEHVFYHCARALLRSAVWEEQTWAPDAVPPRAVIAKAVERQNESLADLEEYYGERYRDTLY
ncbi:MSMEG_1061 family FMN-dependent PPOX-type flavoprotein [Actinoplanes sp. NPDC023714]|uniref:MSMEG_1061 family FMN-dependent PPOX-type flavoprotein n=1 Tax=Actinoplanes sp. NPDC023714 TaxID=3154322 RepID=UPI0033F781F7